MQDHIPIHHLWPVVDLMFRDFEGIWLEIDGKENVSKSLEWAKKHEDISALCAYQKM